MTLDGVKYNIEIKCPFSTVYEFDKDEPLKKSPTMIKKLKSKKISPNIQHKTIKKKFNDKILNHKINLKIEYDQKQFKINLIKKKNKNKRI